MELRFSSVEEVKDFVSQLKGTRGKKGDADEVAPSTQQQAPAPLMPPNPGQFTPPGATGFTPQAAFPAGPGAQAAPPAVAALVQRINVRIDAAIAGGQPVDAVLNWFRQRCGPEAAAATLDQIKNQFLAKLSVPNLEETAKVMGA